MQQRLEKSRAAAARAAARARVASLRTGKDVVQDPCVRWSTLAEKVESLRVEASCCRDERESEKRWEKTLDAAEELFGSLSENWKFVPRNDRKLAISARCSSALELASLRRKRGEPREAADTLRRVLLDARDDEPDYCELWESRGRIFQDMLDEDSTLGARMLVEMHAEKAKDRDETCVESYEAIKADVDRRAALSIHHKVAEQRQHKTPARLCSEGDAYMRERFFLSASLKYEQALVAQVDRHDAEQDIRICCHLNLAACLTLSKQDPHRALYHCEEALAIDPHNTVGLLRRADAHQRCGKYDAARIDLVSASTIFLNRGETENHDRTKARLQRLAYLETTRAIE